MNTYLWYNDIDIYGMEWSTSTDSYDEDDVVVKKLASMFAWEDGMPNFSIRENRELLKERVLEYGLTCMQYEGPKRCESGRYPSCDSIEVAFKKMKTNENLGQYRGTPMSAHESGSILLLRQKDQH